MRRPWLTFLLVLLPAVAAAAPLKRVRIDAGDAQTLSRELELQGLDVLAGSVTDGSLEVVVTDRDLRALEGRGYSLRILEVGRPFREIQAERQRGGVPPGYPDLGTVVAQMDSLATAHPSICQLVDLTAEFGVAATFEGRHLHAVKVSDHVGQDEDEPALLVVSAHHCREIVTPVIGLYAIEQLVSGYGADPTITDVVDSYEIWIAPVWNPDGYEYVFSGDNLWRKNRRVFPEGVGVDLNRNYSQGWSSPCGGSPDPSSLTYRGPEPDSESETQTMIAWSQREYFAKVLDYHSSGREALYGYACWNHPFHPWMEQEAVALSQASGYGGSHRPASAHGEHYQWQFARQGAHAFLIETANEFQPPYASALVEAALVWPGILWMLQRPVPLWGFVTDASADVGIEASITYAGALFEHGESVPTDPASGRYHAFLPPGTYDVVVEAGGYVTQTVPGITIGPAGSVRLDVQLTPEVTAVALRDERDEQTRLLFSDPIRRTVHFEVGRAAHVRLAIYDLRGALVRTLEDRRLAAGRYERRWNGFDDRGAPVGSGTYFYRLGMDDRSYGGKMLRVR